MTMQPYNGLSEFVGGPWDGEHYPPVEWDDRWKIQVGIERGTVLVFGDKGALVGRYESTYQDRGAWRWQREVESNEQH